MHDLRVVTLNKVRLVATSAVQSLQICVTGASLCGRTGNFIAVEVQNRKDRTVSHRVEKVDRLPASLKWAGLGLAITDDAGDNQVGIVESGAECMDQRVAKLSSLMHRIGDMRPAVAGHPAGRRELAKHKAQAFLIQRDFWVNLGVGAFQIRAGIQGGASMSWSRDVNDVRIMFFDEAIQMNVNEVLPRRSSPVSEKARFYL